MEAQMKEDCPFGHIFGTDHDRYEECNFCLDQSYRACGFELHWQENCEKENQK